MSEGACERNAGRCSVRVLGLGGRCSAWRWKTRRIAAGRKATPAVLLGSSGRKFHGWQMRQIEDDRSPLQLETAATCHSVDREAGLNLIWTTTLLRRSEGYSPRLSRQFYCLPSSMDDHRWPLVVDEMCGLGGTSGRVDGENNATATAASENKDLPVEAHCLLLHSGRATGPWGTGNRNDLFALAHRHHTGTPSRDSKFRTPLDWRRAPRHGQRMPRCGLRLYAFKGRPLARTCRVRGGVGSKTLESQTQGRVASYIGERMIDLGKSYVGWWLVLVPDHICTHFETSRLLVLLPMVPIMRL